MLKFYGNPISPNARRVWLTLLEKQVPFQLELVQLNGDQLQPEFLAVNPFHHIPAVVDDGFRIVESIAILDYLEAKYPAPPLLPSSPQDLATVRMVQLVTSNELFPAMLPLLTESEDTPQFEQAKPKVAQAVDFLAQQLGDRPFFGSDRLTLADIVAGVALPLLPRLGMPLTDHPNLDAWHQRIAARSAWQQLQLSDEDFTLFRRRVRAMVLMRRRELARQ